MYFDHLMALSYCGVFLTEFISRLSFHTIFITQLYRIFKKTRFSLSATFIFLFFLLIIIFSILLSMEIFDYTVSTSFSSLDADMIFINPLLWSIDFILNLYFVTAFIKKLYQVTYYAFYTTPQQKYHHVKDNNGSGSIEAIQLSVLNNINEYDEESVGTTDDLSHSQYLTVNDSLTLSTVIPFDENDQNDENIVHVIQRIKLLDIMCRTVLLSMMAALCIETVIIYRIIHNFMDLHTHSRIHGRGDEVMRILMCLSMLVNGIVVTLNMNVSKRGYKILCLKAHSCIEMCCIRIAKKNIRKSMIRKLTIDQEDRNYKEMIDYYE